MKIVHAVYSLEMGGAEVLVAQLARIHRAQGHDVSLLAYSQLGAVGETLRAEGFSIYVPGEASPARTMLRYFQHLRGLHPDVVHCHNPAPTLQAALPARLAGVPVVLSTRHSLVAPPYDRAAEIKYSLLATFCTRIIGICDVTCDNLRGAPLAHRRKIVRVYNGAEPLAVAPSTAPPSAPFRLLFVGRLAAIKSLNTALEAVALALPRLPAGLQFSIVGDGPVRPTLEALSRSLGLEAHVQFHGQQLATTPFFAAADCLLMSSLSEGLPMSLVQAMSVGLPAIVTDVGGMAEVLRLSGSGLLSPVGDAAAMADHIIQLAQNPVLRATFSARARTAYQAHFTLTRMAANYMQLYQHP